MTNKPHPTPGYHQESPVFIFLSNPQTVDLGVPCPDLWPWLLSPWAGVPGAPVPARVVSPVTQHTIGSQYTFGGWGLPLLFAPQGDGAPPGVWSGLGKWYGSGFCVQLTCLVQTPKLLIEQTPKGALEERATMVPPPPGGGRDPGGDTTAAQSTT